MIGRSLGTRVSKLERSRELQFGGDDRNGRIVDAIIEELSTPDRRALLAYWHAGGPQEQGVIVRPIFERIAAEFAARGGKVPERWTYA